MAISGWRDEAIEIFHTPSAGLDRLPGVLSRARSLNAPSHRIWESVVFDWFKAMGRQPSAARKGHDLGVFQALLGAGLDPHAGALSIEDIPNSRTRQAALRELHRVATADPRRNTAAARLALGSPPPRPHAASHVIGWLARTLWAARDCPDLPGIAQAFIDAGAHPHDRGPFRFDPSTGQLVPAPGDRQLPASAWPSALCAGRLDALEVLGAAAGPHAPPDWSSAVKAVFRHAQRSHASWSRVVPALEWFTRRFPPTPEQARDVLDFLAPTDEKGAWTRERSDALAVWLSLPSTGLDRPEGPLGCWEGFNPWQCLGNPDSLVAPFHDRVLDILKDHPRFAHADVLASCRVRVYGHPEPVGLLDAWVLDSSRSDARKRSRERLFEVMGERRALSSPGLPALLARSRTCPDAPATRWLMSHRPAWTDPEGATPWHHGPTTAVARWLRRVGISPFEVDARGRSGFAQALVEGLRGNSNGARSDLPDIGILHRYLVEAPEAVDWTEIVRGRTLWQWVRGDERLLGWLPERYRTPGVQALASALEIGHLPTIRKLCQALAKGAPQARLSVSDSVMLIEAWLSGTQEDPEQRAKALALVVPRLAPDLGDAAAAGRWLSRALARHAAASDTRPDVAGIWEFYGPGGKMGLADARALREWSASALNHQAVYGSPSWGPWSGSSWPRHPPRLRAALAASILGWSLSVSGSTRDLHFSDAGRWFKALAKVFPEPEALVREASPARLRRLCGLLEGRVEELRKKTGEPLPEIVAAWRPGVRACLMELALPEPPDAQGPARLRL